MRCSSGIVCNPRSYGNPTRTTILYAIGWAATGTKIEDKNGDCFAWLTKDLLITLGTTTGGIEYTYLN